MFIYVLDCARPTNVVVSSILSQNKMFLASSLPRRAFARSLLLRPLVLNISTHTDKFQLQADTWNELRFIMKGRGYSKSEVSELWLDVKAGREPR